MTAEDLNRNVELRQRLLRRLVWKTPLIVALVSFALWWQSNNQRVASKDRQTRNSQTATMLAGSWTAEVTYRSGERRNEQFFFQPEGDKLFGTVSFLGSKRAIEDGQIAGAIISFTVRFEEVADRVAAERWQRYEGKLEGNEIHLKLFDDKGNPPLEFRLAKSIGAGGESTAAKP